MAEQSKFAGALGRLKQPAAPTGANPAADESAAPPSRTIEEPTRAGSRGGKRSDPAYSPTTFFVRKETKRKAARLLEDQDADKDLSDLVEELLAHWVTKSSHL